MRRVGRVVGPLVAAMLALAPLPARAQDPGAAPAAGTRTVRLRDGSMVRGDVVEEVPGDHVVVRLVTGEVRRIAWADLVEVTPPEGAALPAAPPIPLAPPAPPAPSGPTVILNSDDPRAGLCALRPEVVTWVGRRGFTHQGVALDWGQVCQGTCNQAVLPGQYMVCGDGVRASEVFSVPPSSAVRLDVNAHSSWIRSIGILLTTVGLGAVVPGAVLVAIGERAAPLGNPWFTVPDRTKVVGGGVALGVGAAMTVLGTVMLAGFRTRVVMDGQQVALKVPGTQLSLGPEGLRF